MVVRFRNRTLTIFDDNLILKYLLVTEDPDANHQVKPWTQAHHDNRQQVQFIAEHRRLAIRVRHLQSVESVLEEEVEQGKPKQDWLAHAKEKRAQDYDNHVGKALHDGEFWTAINIFEMRSCLSVRVSHISWTACPLIDAALE